VRHTAVPLLRTLTKARSNRINALQKRVKWIENHSHGSDNAIAEVKQIKQELAELLEEEAKADILRRLLLYSCKIRFNKQFRLVRMLIRVTIVTTMVKMIITLSQNRKTAKI
jgi:hypothetical protein